MVFDVIAAAEPLSPMLPPVGLKAIVLSSSTVVLYWTDSTLPRNQQVTDNRHYTVRYSPYSSPSAKHRYFNSTDLNCMIDDLRSVIRDWLTAVRGHPTQWILIIAESLFAEYVNNKCYINYFMYNKIVYSINIGFLYDRLVDLMS